MTDIMLENLMVRVATRPLFSMIWGQCMQVLIDKMKHDPDWFKTSESYDPLTLLNMIEKKILAQKEDQYCYSIVYG